MALKWIIGDFRNGAISESNDLPVVYNEGDKVEIDVNANESATITVSKNDLPSDWRTYLRPIDRFVALVETDLAWASSVIWAGFINKASARVNETIQIQATGLREYMAARIVSDKYNTTNTNPETAVVFQSSTHRGLMANIISSCFSSSGIPSSSPKPPQVLSSVTGTVGGTTVKHSVLLSDFESYGNLLDEWRDELSDAGQEYRFTPSWSSSSKTAIRWIGEVATPTAPHFNEANTLDIVLGDNEWKPLSYGQSASSDNMVSRIIGQSKEGKNTTGTDYQTRTITLANSILLDEAWNPGVELTNDQMFQNLNSRLVYNSQSFKEADFSRAYETTAELRTIISQLGSMATFSGSGASQYFGLTMRIVGVSFNPSKKTVELQLAPKAARYPKLPKDNRGLKKKSQTRNTGRPKTGINGLPGHYGDYNIPITKQPYPGYNGTTPIPGGVVSPEDVKEIIDQEKKPPFTVPNDDYQDDNPVITSSEEVRLFKSPRMLKEEDGNTGTSRFDTLKYTKKYIDPTRARFNHKTGEYIGLNMPYQTRYHKSNSTSDTSYYVGERFVDLEIYAYDFNGLFEAHSGSAYQDSALDSVNNTHPIIGDNHKKLIATIPQSMYQDISLSILNFEPQIPKGQDTFKYSAVRGIYDYSFFCSEDFKTLYVSIVYNISGWAVVDNKTKSWSYTSNKVLKGVRNDAGVVESWSDLGNVFATQDITGDYIYHSPSIYELNGSFVSFGGYILPQLEQGVDIDEVRTDGSFKGVPKLPYYSMKFYNNRIANVNLNGFYPTPVGLNLNLPDYYGADTVMSEFQIPYAVKVDYDRRKICIGISRGPNNTSIFYEMNFDFSDIFKILQTQKETKEIARQKGTAGNSFYQPNESVFKFSLNTPVFYKGNYVLIDAEGYEVSSGGIIDNNRGLRYTRGKKGFDDSVSGKLNFPEIPSSVVYYKYPVKDVLRLFNYNANIGNKIGAFHSYYTHAQGELSVNYNTLYSSGFDYFSYKGKIYVVSNSFFAEPYATYASPDFTKFQHLEKTLVWVGKFNMDDSKIIQQ